MVQSEKNMTKDNTSSKGRRTSGKGGFKKDRPAGRPEKRAQSGRKRPPKGVLHKEQAAKTGNSEEMRLNKYIAHAGICSRREADRLIEAGAVKINGKTVSDLGHKVLPGDKVQVGEQSIRPERMVYLLLNKPKAFITTTDDPFNRRTVMALVQNACKERLYPVGRLDRNTTGLLLFTNDGELAEKLMHPSNNVHKIYHATIDKNLKREHFDAIARGIELEDGFIKADKIAWVGDGQDHRQIGLEIHSGKNRIVRRIFEHFDYQVIKLDRVIFAGLTKKDLPRGKYRFLTQKEINFLKML